MAEDGLAKIVIVDLCVEIDLICSGYKVRSQWALDDRVSILIFMLICHHRDELARNPSLRAVKSDRNSDGDNVP